eukprot:scaffold36376_cov59-Phaeocystis_antarctica.AAC.2
MSRDAVHCYGVVLNPNTLHLYLHLYLSLRGGAAGARKPAPWRPNPDTQALCTVMWRSAL